MVFVAYHQGMIYHSLNPYYSLFGEYVLSLRTIPLCNCAHISNYVYRVYSLYRLPTSLDYLILVFLVS